MRIATSALAATLVLGTTVSLGLAAPAHAATTVLTDPADDVGGGVRLDVTRAALHNDDRAVVARVAFAEDVRGDLIVSLDPRGDTGVRLVASKSRDGSVSSQLLAGAFTDRGAVGEDPECRGLRVSWTDDVARLRMPSRCLHEGDYGAVRFSVLTENRNDSDLAPDRGSSDWVPRG